MGFVSASFLLDGLGPGRNVGHSPAFLGAADWASQKSRPRRARPRLSRSVRDGQGVIAIAEDLRGPLVDRSGFRLAAAPGRAAVLAAARDALDRCDLAGATGGRRCSRAPLDWKRRIDFDPLRLLLC